MVHPNALSYCSEHCIEIHFITMWIKNAKQLPLSGTGFFCHTMHEEGKHSPSQLLSGGNTSRHMCVNIFRKGSVRLFQKHFASTSEIQFCKELRVVI